LAVIPEEDEHAMLPWGFLLDESALAAVLPNELAPFRRPLAGALTVFLEGLPPEHQAALLEDQAALAPDTSPSRRLGVLARSCPALHKLGQVLARDRRLPAELRGHLQELESLPPSVEPATIEALLTRELGPLGQRGVTLLPPALAEASVAVVIPFRDERTHQQGVFKVLKPGVQERLELELELLGRVGADLDQRCAELGIPPLDYQESFQQVRDKLRHEVRLDLEQLHLARAGAVYAGQPRVRVPALLEHCTPRVTAMERLMGVKVTEHGLTCPDERRCLADLVVEALIAGPIFSRDEEALFHGDPHAGNLLLTTDGRLGLLDWSLVGVLGERERIAFAQMVLGSLTLDGQRILTALEALAQWGRIDRPALASVVQIWLGRIRQGHFPRFTSLMGLLDDAVQKGGLRVGADLLLFRKTLHTLEGVVADVGAEERIDAVLLRHLLGHFLAEYPRRWLTLPGSRAFATRLSNADLMEAVLGWPCTVATFWLGA
jgi:ubiquinone biosynthesis protein